MGESPISPADWKIRREMRLNRRNCRIFRSNSASSLRTLAIDCDLRFGGVGIGTLEMKFRGKCGLVSCNGMWVVTFSHRSSRLHY